MARIQVADQLFEIEAIAFDKDGTLVDFDRLWNSRTQRWIDHIVELANGTMLMRYLLAAALGFDGARVLPDSPMAIGTMGQLYAIAASVLFQLGMGWHDAEVLVAKSADLFDSAPKPTELQPRGDLTTLFAKLTGAGVQIAVNTSDNRAGTEATLAMLGVQQFVGAVVCGDDGLPAKPDPASLYAIAEQLAVAPAQMMFVGDTVSDLTTGKRAGVRAAVGVLGGGGDAELVRISADVVVHSLDEIVVL